MNRRDVPYNKYTGKPEPQYMPGTQYYSGDSCLDAFNREHGCLDFSKPENDRRLSKTEEVSDD